MKTVSASILGRVIVTSGLLLSGGTSYAGTLNFNGSSGYVSVGSRPELKVTGTSFTLEAWIKPTGRGSDATEGGVIFGREGEYMLARFADGTIRYAVGTTAPGWAGGWINPGYKTPTNEWTHIALTYDGSFFQVYTNAVRVDEFPASGPVGDGDAARNDFLIGTRQLTGRYFQGQIDEVRVWNLTHSAPEILAYMNRPLQGNEAGLVGYYRFDEGFGTTTADATGRGLTGTLIGGVLWDPVSESLKVPVPITRPAALLTETTARLNASVSRAGIATSNSFRLATNSSTALSFDGINDAVSFAVGPNYFYNAYPLTVTAWIKTEVPGVSGGIVNKYVSGSRNGWQIFLINGQLRAWYFRDTSSYASAGLSGNDGLNGGNVDDGQWHHAALTVGPTGGKVYVDGLLTATNAWTGPPGPPTTLQTLRFGLYDVFFAGQLDDITLWKEELTPAVIAQLMTSPPTPAHPQFGNLLGYWPLDEGTGNSVSDAWNRFPAGTLAGDPQWVPQARPLQYFATPLAPVNGANSVLDLDGVDDHVRVPSGTWFSNEFTIESWVYERSYGANARVMDFGNGAPRDNVILSLADSISRPYFAVAVGTGVQSITAPDPLPLDQWVHLAATLKSNVGTIYINGVAVVSGQVTAPNGTILRTNNYIGRSAWPLPGDTYANALYDDLRLWNVARTPAQIRQFMTEAVSPGDANLLLNYRFDEASGPTVVDDRSVTPQNGTLSNGAARLPFERPSVDLAGLTRATRYHFRSVAATTNGTELGLIESFATPTPAAGTALNFNGRNDYLHTPNLRSYFTSETVTIEVWFNARGPGVVVDERQSGDLSSWNDSQIEILATTSALEGEVRMRVWNSAALVLGKVTYGTWNHAALRYDKSALRLDGFLNGVQPAGGISVDRIAPWEGTASFGLVYALGLQDANSLGSGAWFNGQMDEFRVWNVARNATSILQDFNRRLLGNEAGLVVYYRMDEGAGSMLADATGLGNDGLRLGTNGPAWIPSTAPVGWPLVTTSEVSDIVLGDVTLDATVKGDATSDTRVWIEYGQYVPVPNSAQSLVYFYANVPTVPSPVTLLSQVNFDALPTNVTTFTTIDWWIPAGSRPPECPICPEDRFAARYVGRIFLPASGTYTFYTASDDGSQLYLDGQLVVTNDGLHGWLERGATLALTGGYHWLEARMFDNLDAAGLSVSYAGPGIPKQVIPATAFLRHEAVYTGRTAPQIDAAAAGFQDFSAMATNLSGGSNYVFRVVAANGNGTNYGPAQPVLMGTPGAFTALFFNGIGANVLVPEGTNSLAFPGTDPFTIEAWINPSPSTIAVTQAVVSKFNQPAQREYFLALNPQRNVVFHRQGSDYVSLTTIPEGQYTHVAATYDGTYRRIYVNGQLDSAVDPGSGPITNSGAPFLIGARYWYNSPTNFFFGIIDDVRVWQVARSHDQIARDMNRRLSGYELGLVGYYRFDEAQGDVATDHTVGSHVGLLRNGPVYVPTGVQFACTSAPPVLHVDVLEFDEGVIVWWPITCNEYILEQSDIPNAPPEGWYPVLEPVTPIGESYLVVFLLDRYNNGFFRLRRL